MPLDECNTSKKDCHSIVHDGGIADLGRIIALLDDRRMERHLFCQLVKRASSWLSDETAF